jgi:carbonic anhydrase
MRELLPVKNYDDIPDEYKNTPIGLLLEYHNLDKPFKTYERAELIVGMCMDNRKHLHMPDNFSFIIRTGGANLRYSEFKVSFAISIGQVGHLALIGHTQCGMVNLISRKKEFIEGLINIAGWDRERAEEHFQHYAPMFEIGNETDFILSEAIRLRLRYPRIKIAPMLYKVEDNKLYFIRED